MLIWSKDFGSKGGQCLIGIAWLLGVEEDGSEPLNLSVQYNNYVPAYFMQL